MGVSEQLRIPIICGPTASGKTGVAMDLAGEYAVEIISADSRQIIKYLDIGTAKPTIEEQRKVSFHLIDLIEPGERYSAVRFLVDSDRAVSDILNRGHIPLVVGGTGLYLRALTEGVVKIEENDNPELREKLQRQMEELGPEEMHRRLAELDPDEAARIHPNNKVRVIRALEICELAGQSKTTLVASGAYKKSKYEYEYFCLVPPRDELYAIINKRVGIMIEQGLLTEIETLVARGMGERIKRANVIGYSELLDYLEKTCSLEDALDLIRQNTRRYAKRQMTWLRNQVEGREFADSTGLRRAVTESLVEFGPS